MTSSNPPTDRRMSLVEHLTELRRRVMISIAAIVVGAIVAFVFWDVFLRFLTSYYQDALDDPTARLTVLGGPIDGISVRLQMASYGGFVLALPVWLWQLWRFITPGLYAKEKRYAVPFLISSIVLFGFGAWLAFATLPRALDFLVSYAGRDVDLVYSPKGFVQFVVLIVVAFGVAFQFPVLLTFLQIAGVVRPSQLLKWWRHAIVVIFVIAAVITPSQDPWSLFGMAVPMCAFYFVSIAIGKLLRR